MTRTQTKLTFSTPMVRGKTRAVKKRKADQETSTRVIIPERGIVPASEKHGDIEGWLMETISALGWEIFIEPPERACSEFVSAFLEAFSPEHFPSVTIEGKKVIFSETEINETYNTPPVPLEEDEYEKYCKGRNDRAVTDEILKTLCQEGTQWEKGESLLRKNLSFEGKVWMHLVNSRLIPASHDTRVNWERAVLAFCIITQRKFDVGRIIQKQLLGNMKRKQPFYFPCLVTELCKRAGLKLKHPESAEVIPTANNIDQGTLKRIRENDGMEEEEGSKKEEEEDDEETVDGESGSIRKEDQVESPQPAQRSQPRKTSAKKMKKPEEGSTSEARSMWARGVDIAAQQIQNIERMVAEELQHVITASNLITQEKEQLERELEQLRSEGVTSSKKRKAESSGTKSDELLEVMKTNNEMISTLKQELDQREARHQEEKISWKQEREGLKEMLLQICKYVRDRDAVMDANWAAKFRGQPRFPSFPEILAPEAIEGAPVEGAPTTQEQ